MAENGSAPVIFQFFQNIFSFPRNGFYLLISLDFLFFTDFAGKLVKNFFIAH